MEQTTVTLIVAALGIGGTLSGTVVGNLFQSRGQHKQWRRDKAIKEADELLGQLTVNLFAFIEWRKSPQSGNFADQYSNDVRDLHRNFGSRIVIANELKRANIPNRWYAAVNEFNGDLKKLNADYEKIKEEIVKIALKA